VTDFHIKIYAAPSARTSAAKALVERLLAHGEIVSFRWFRRDSDATPHVLTQGNIGPWLNSALEELWESTGYVNSWFMLHGALGEMGPLFLSLQGDNRALGGTPIGSESIGVLCDLRDLMRDLVRDMDELVRSKSRTTFVRDFAAQAELSSRELFEVVSGARSAEPTHVLHALMSLGGWLPPAECAMIYHHDAIELVRDLARNHVCRALKTPAFLTFDPVAGLSTAVPGVDWMKVGSLSPAELDEIVASAVAAARDASAEVLERKFHITLGEGGLLDMLEAYDDPEVLAHGPARAIMTNPMSSLKSFYVHLAEGLAGRKRA